MNARRFRELVDAYGAEPRRWPVDIREVAQAFASTAEGQSLLYADAALDTHLDAWTAVQPSPDLRTRVLAHAPRQGRWVGLRQRWSALLAPGAGLAAAGVAGVLFGAVLSNGSADTSAESLLADAGAYDETLVLAEAER